MGLDQQLLGTKKFRGQRKENGLTVLSTTVELARWRSAWPLQSLIDPQGSMEQISLNEERLNEIIKRLETGPPFPGRYGEEVRPDRVEIRSWINAFKRAKRWLLKKERRVYRIVAYRGDW